MISKRHTFAVIVAVAGLLGTQGAVADPVTFTKDVALRSEARFDASPVAQVKQGTVGDADLTTKKGGFITVKTPAGTGWALTTDFNFGTGTAGSSGGGGFSNPFGRSRTASTTNTIGIRGFDKETIGNAFGDGGAVSAAQLALLDGYAVDKSGGQSFASAQGLTASSVNY